jgi:hypothetical protein
MCRISHLLCATLLVAFTAVSVRSAEVEPLLPKEAEQVFQANIKQIVGSDIFKKYAQGRIEKATQNDEVKKQFEMFGIDPFKDVEKVTVSTWNNKDPLNLKALIIIRGKFDVNKLFDGVSEHAKMTPDRLSIENVEDGDESWKVVKVTPDRGGKPFFVSVANDTTIVGGSEAKLVTTALNAAKNKEKSKLSKEMSALVLKQDEKASLFYCSVMEGQIEVDRIPDGVFDPLKAFGIDGDVLKKQIAAISTFAVTLRVGKEVGVELTAGMKDEDTAEEFGGEKSNLSRLIDTAKNFLPLLSGREPKMELIVADISKTIKSKVKGKDVIVSVTFTAEAIGKAVGEDE